MEGRAAAIEPDATDMNQQMENDYVLLIAKSTLQQAEKALTDDASVQTIGALLDKLEGKMGDASGFAARHMFHGIRLKGERTTDTLPLFDLSGQLFPVEGNTATEASLTLFLDKPEENHWNFSFQGESTQLLISSDQYSYFKSPKEIADELDLTFEPKVLCSQELDIAQEVSKDFGISIRTPWTQGDQDALILWQLPPRMISAISLAKGEATFELQEGKVALDGKVEEPKSLHGKFNWTTQIRFTVRRIIDENPPASGEKAEPGYLPGVYELIGVDALDLLLLLDMLNDSANLTEAGFSVVYPSIKEEEGLPKREKFIERFNSPGEGLLQTALVQTNLSTESRPQNVSLFFNNVTADPNPTLIDFLTKLWQGGITNSGGYYLSYQDTGNGESPGLPESVFDENNRVDLYLVVMYPPSLQTLKAYVNGILTHDVLDDGNTLLCASSSQIKEITSAILPGNVGIYLERELPIASSGEVAEGEKKDYGPSLENLYNLLTAYVNALGDSSLEAPAKTSGIGPVEISRSDSVCINVETEASKDDKVWQYRQVFPLTQEPSSGTLLSEPEEESNPYRFIGDDIHFFSRWTDIFGNILQEPTVGIPNIPSLYFDPVLNLESLPNFSSTYLFKPGPAGGSALLSIQFKFDPQPYLELLAGNNQNAVPENVTSDLQVYSKFYYQLLQDEHFSSEKYQCLDSILCTNTRGK